MILQAYDFLELSRRRRLPRPDGRIGPVGQYRQRHRAVTPRRRHRGVRRHHAADHHGGRRQDGQDHVGRGLAQCQEQLPHYDYWQFWRNTDDRDVGKFLRLFTDLPLDEIARLEKLEGAEINEAKKILANEATAMCRGRDAAVEAAETGAHLRGRQRRRLAPHLHGRGRQHHLSSMRWSRSGSAASKGEARG
jgi:tyrosyl-tRNA synthetase